MKKVILLLLLSFVFTISFSQKNKKASIEIYFLTTGKTFPYSSGSAPVGGNINPTGNRYYNIGTNYIKPLNNWLSVLGGAEFSNHNIKTTYSYIPDPIGMPTLASEPSYNAIQLLSFPVNIQADFLKYFYARTGFIVDFETKNNSSYFTNQSGIGLNFEIGAKYSFKNHVTLFLSPFFQTHGTILFHSKQYAYKIDASGINLGIGYRF